MRRILFVDAVVIVEALCSMLRKSRHDGDMAFVMDGDSALAVLARVPSDALDLHAQGRD